VYTNVKRRRSTRKTRPRIIHIAALCKPLLCFGVLSPASHRLSINNTTRLSLGPCTKPDGTLNRPPRDVVSQFDRTPRRINPSVHDHHNTTVYSLRSGDCTDTNPLSSRLRISPLVLDTRPTSRVRTTRILSSVRPRTPLRCIFRTPRLTRNRTHHLFVPPSRSDSRDLPRTHKTRCRYSCHLVRGQTVRRTTSLGPLSTPTS